MPAHHPHASRSILAQDGGGENGETEGFLRLSPPLEQQHSVLDAGLDGGDGTTGFSDFYYASASS